MSAPSSTSTSRLQNIFGVDLRSLALFRVLLGAVLLVTLLGSFCNLGALYTDSGVAPRSWVMDVGASTRLSLYFLNGSFAFTTLLLLIQTVAALMLLLGWRTRLASVVSFVLWASLMSRNPDVLMPADSLMAGLLFWSLFLPLGARYSMEAALNPAPANPQNQYLSWASAGLLVQIIAPYFFSTLAAYSDAQTHQSLVLFYWLNLDGYATSLAQSLLASVPLHTTLSRLMFVLSLISPLLIFAPVFTQATRLLAMIGFGLMQIFMLIFFDLGTLPWVSLAALAALPGASFWSWLKHRDERRNSGALRIYYDSTHPFSHAMCRVLQEFLILPRAEIHAAQDTPRTRSLMLANHSWVVLDASDQATMKWSALVTLLRHSPVFFWKGALLSPAFLQKPGDALYDALARHRATLNRFCVERTSAQPEFNPHSLWKLFSALMLIATLLSSFAAVQWLPHTIGSGLTFVLQPLRLDQTWTLYSIPKLENDGWLMVNAKLTNGSEVDLLRANSTAPDFNKPPHSVIAADGTRWLSYRNQLWQDDSPSHRRLYGRYLCAKWNDAHASDDTKLAAQLTFIYMLERTSGLTRAPQIEQRILGTQECPPVQAELTR